MTLHPSRLEPGRALDYNDVQAVIDCAHLIRMPITVNIPRIARPRSQDNEVESDSFSDDPPDEHVATRDVPL